MSETMFVIKRDGSRVPVDMKSIRRQTEAACEGIDGVQYELLEQKAKVVFYDGIKTEDIQKALIKTAEQLVDIDRPNYAYVAGRLILFDLYRHVEYIYGNKRKKDDPNIYRRITLKDYFNKFGVAFLDDFYKAYSDEEIEELNDYIIPENDFLFTNTAIRIAKTQYLARSKDIDTPKGEEDKSIVELPQHMLMCIAMHNCQYEDKSVRMDFVKRIYSTFSYQYAVPATPHLSYSRIRGGSSASCLVTSVRDNIESIFENFVPGVAYGSKGGAGLGGDISRIRSQGSPVGQNKNASKGKVPLCALLDRLTLYIDQGGKRKGAMAVTIRTFDIDIFSFLALRNQQGEERKRAHNLSIAVAADDVFMERWEEYNRLSNNNASIEEIREITYTLFDPYDVPDLCEKYGEDFKKRYLEYEKEFLNNPKKFNSNTEVVPVGKVVHAILSTIAKTNYPYVTFIDTVNNKHRFPELGIIRCGNLCQEVMMPADDDQIAVCNLASINLARTSDNLDILEETSKVLVRFLDNSIDTTRYPHINAEKTQKRYRSIGIGCMGEAEYIAVNKIHFGSDEHKDYINKIYGFIRNVVEKTSNELVNEKGSCAIEGVRNAYLMCVAPNTSSGVFGSTTSGIEPTYGRVFTDSRTGNYAMRITAPKINIDNYEYYKTAFEIDQYKMIDMTAERQKHIDMSISHSIFKDMNNCSLLELSSLYVYAWKKGLKSLYYLRGKKNNDKADEKENCTMCAN